MNNSMKGSARIFVPVLCSIIILSLIWAFSATTPSPPPVAFAAIVFPSALSPTDTVSAAHDAASLRRYSQVIVSTAPDLEMLVSVADAYTRENYPNSNSGTGSSMRSGHELDQGTMRSYLRFDLSSIPSEATIDSASLVAYALSSSGSPTIEVWRAGESWVEGTITWNNKPDCLGVFFPDPFASEVISSSPAFVSWDVTLLVSLWFDGTYPNDGLCLKGPTSGDSWAQFKTREHSVPLGRPYLQISYSLPEETISTPSTPTGPSSGEVGQSLSYSTGGATSSLGHSLQYRFDWDDGSYSSWSSSTSSLHSWSTAGTYNVKAQARCAIHTDKVSSWSGGKSVSQYEETVSTPSIPTGPSSGEEDQSLSYSTGGATSSLGHSLQYRFDWGDGEYSSWSSSTSAFHSWSNPGEYTVRVEARCATHTLVVSDWSGAKNVLIAHPALALSPSSGPEGTGVDLTGSSFIPMDTIPVGAITFGGAAWNTAPCVVAMDGEWSLYLSVPASGIGVRTVAVTTSGGSTASTVFTVLSPTPTPGETISTPSTPTGPSSGEVGQSLSYSTGGATSSMGHSLQYRFDWGDGEYSSWSSSTSAFHSWSSDDTYTVRAQARCATHTDKVSSWSSGKTVDIDPSPTPEETISTPSTPTGPSSGEEGQSLSYSTGGATSSMGHSLQYRFDWGDGEYSSWSSSTSAFHSWSPDDTYTVRAQARCATHTDVVSSWSDALSVEINLPSDPSEIDETPPWVNIVYSPDSPTAADEVTFTATAADLSGILRIEVFVEGSEVAQCSSSPCIYIGGPYSEGTVSYYALAWDGAENQATSDLRSLMIGPEADTTPPEVSITHSPEHPTTADAVTFTATAEDVSGIVRIEIFIEDTGVTECSSSPCIYVGSPYSEGTVSYYALAWDGAENQATTDLESVAIGPEADTTPPEVSITHSPEHPTTADAVTFTAISTDASGINRIQVFVEGSEVSECSSSPCTYVGGPYPEGILAHYATARDSANNESSTGDQICEVEAAGKLDEADALHALRMYVNLEPVDLIADMNEDGTVTPDDARIILQQAVQRRG